MKVDDDWSKAVAAGAHVFGIKPAAVSAVTGHEAAGDKRKLARNVAFGLMEAWDYTLAATAAVSGCAEGTVYSGKVWAKRYWDNVELSAVA